MGWFCLKGFPVNLHVLKQPKNSDKPLFEEKEDIILHLYMNWKDLQQDSSVIEALNETIFVTGAEGDLCDPGDVLLTSLFSRQPHKFPLEKFVSDGWLKIVRKTGLQNTRDIVDIVLRYARRIEFLGMKHVEADMENQVSLEIWFMAETLIETIFENSVLLHDRNFCNVFGKIACIPAEKGYPFNMGKRGVKRVLCSYNNAVLLKDWALAWSVTPILSNKSLVPPDYSWGALQLRSPPPFTIVLNHFQCRVSRSLSCCLAIEAAVLEILKYLHTNWGTLSSSDISKLSDLAFISTANGALLVPAGCLVTNLKINLRPIAHELPSHYLSFVKILTELGLHDTLSISSAMAFLSRLRHYVLNPNELRAVIELLNFICNEIEQHKSDRSNWESELIVPDNDGRLVRPNLCLYIDPFGSRYVRYIDSSKLRLVHHDVSERLCLAFGIRKLSDVVVEELDRVERLETHKEIGSVSLAAIRQKLLRFKNPAFPTLRRSLDYVAERLEFVKSIYTRFWLLPKSLDVTRASMDSINPKWESESSHRALYCVDRSNTCMLIAEPTSYMPVLDLVAIVVSHVLGSPVPLPIASLFLYPHDSETVVNIPRVPFDEREMDSATQAFKY